MNADELQRWASILRWVGLSVTAIGILITFGSHYVADKLLVVQRADKIKAQERQKISDEQLAAANAKAEEASKLAAELESRQKPRVLPDTLVQSLITTASQATRKDDLEISCVVGDPEAWALAGQIKGAFESAGFKFERIVPVITTPPVIGIAVSSRDISPSPVHACVAAILNHFAIPLKANPVHEGNKATWIINIGKKP